MPVGCAGRPRPRSAAPWFLGALSITSVGPPNDANLASYAIDTCDQQPLLCCSHLSAPKESAGTIWLDRGFQLLHVLTTQRSGLALRYRDDYEDHPTAGWHRLDADDLTIGTKSYAPPCASRRLPALSIKYQTWSDECGDWMLRRDVYPPWSPAPRTGGLQHKLRLLW